MCVHQLDMHRPVTGFYTAVIPTITNKPGRPGSSGPVCRVDDWRQPSWYEKQQNNEDQEV